jgi:hypothetical protein
MPLDLVRGDIVALRRGSKYDELLGVVTVPTSARIRVSYRDDAPDSVYRTSNGMSLNKRKAEVGWHIQPLDAVTRHDILTRGFWTGQCSRAQLERMEYVARVLRRIILRETV